MVLIHSGVMATSQRARRGKARSSWSNNGRLLRRGGRGFVLPIPKVRFSSSLLEVERDARRRIPGVM
jgi:hypothetical protein